jgi:phosphatidylglycerophosphate synthase
MLDIQLRPLKDTLFDSVTPLVPSACSPLHITFLAFSSGVLSCIYAASNRTLASTTFWALNRALDCLDGAVARKRNQSSDLGGFFDLLGDFIVYSAIPISCALARNAESNAVSIWLSVAVLEASFHVNNFVLFYIGAILEKRKGSGKSEDASSRVKELTSVAMRPALIEGTESAAFFTAMLMYPRYVQYLSWTMALLVCLGITQRTKWLVEALG